MALVVLGTVDILDGGLDGAFSFPDTNCVTKGDDVEVVIGLLVTKDHIHGLLCLWEMNEMKEMDQDLGFCTRLKVFSAKSTKV